MARGTIFDIRRYSIHDGPGIRTTVFFKGCPGRCAWCHNPESQHPGLEVLHWPGRCTGCLECARQCPNGAIVCSDGRLLTLREKCCLCLTCTRACAWDARSAVGRVVGDDEVLQEVAKDVVFFDESGGGITFSGGEPLLQLEFLHGLLDECRSLGMHTAVDTSGFAAPGAMAKTARKADLFLYDLKAVDEERHLRLTGMPASTAMNNLALLAAEHGNVVVRVPVIPGVNDQEMDAIIGFLVSLGKARPRRVDLLAYHELGADKYGRLGRTYALPGLKAPGKDLMESLRGQFTRHGFDARIGG